VSFLLAAWAYRKAIALGVLIAAVPVAYVVGHARGDRQGYDRRIAEQAVADTKAEAERKGDDAKIGNMADYDLCVASLQRRGLPIDACDELRGLQSE